jgi:hypothetical protein
MPGHPFIGLEGERGHQAVEGNLWRWHHDGGGSGRFRRGLVRVVVVSDEGGGCSGRFRSRRGGHREVARTRAREAAVAVAAIRPGEEDDRAGQPG